MRECSKALLRSATAPNLANRWFVGDGLDIGGAPDPLADQTSFFPRMRRVRVWDVGDGDAQTLDGIAPESFDFVHSSHCLEHLRDCRAGLRAWFAAVRPG